MLKIQPDGVILLTKGDTAYFQVDILYDNDSPYLYKDGDTITLSVKKKASDDVYTLQKTVNGGEVITLIPEDTNTLTDGRYVYDVQLNTSLGEVFTVCPTNEFYILEEVTDE